MGASKSHTFDVKVIEAIVEERPQEIISKPTQ